jgi:hypothetical protein
MNHDFKAWILRAGAAGFTAGCRILLRDVPCFGDLVEVRSSVTLFGLIYDVTIQDDPLVRQLVLADALEPQLILDQRENRLVPIELHILSVGYRLDGSGEIVQGLPPQPPASLETLRVCNEVELRAFSGSLTYLQLVLNTPQIPADELLAAHLVRAAATRAPEALYPFLLGAGRELTRLLNADLVRLERLLKRIRPREVTA